jgi:hypothetical protein
MENDDWLEKYIETHGCPHDYDSMADMLHEYEAYLQTAKSPEQPVELPFIPNGLIYIGRDSDGKFRDANDNVWVPERESGEER